MEFEPSAALWRSRGATALDVSTVNSKDGSKLVLITTRDEVLEYCSQSRKCVNHWTFRSNLALRLGAVRNPLSHVLFGVRGAKHANKPDTIVAWRNADADVTKWKATPLRNTSAVTGLFVHPQLSEEVVVVFANGSFAIYDEDLTALLDSSTTTTSKDTDTVTGDVKWAALASDHRNPTKGALFLSLLVHHTTDTADDSSSSSTYELVVYEITATKDRNDARVAATLVTRHAIASPVAATSTDRSSSDTITTAAFHAESFAYSFVWATGAWQRETFTHNAIAQTLEHATTTMQAATLAVAAAVEQPAALPTPVPAAATPSTSHKKRKLAPVAPAAAAVVSPTAPIPTPAALHACSVGASNYLVVASSATFGGFDATFGVQVATTTIDVSAPGDGSSSASDALTPLPVLNAPLLPTSTVGALRKLVSSLTGDVVVAAFEHAVVVVGIQHKRATLASVLGASTSLAATNAAPALPNRLIDWRDVASGRVTPANWTAQLCNESDVEAQFIAKLSDPLVTATAAQFHKTFDAALRTLHPRSVDKHELSYRFIVAVAKRCVASEKLALWTPLTVVLATKRVSARAVPALLPTLMRCRQFALLEAAIRDLCDIDERSIVRLLQFFVRQADAAPPAPAVEPAKVPVAKQPSKKASKRKNRRANDAANDAIDANSTSSSFASERFIIALLALPTNSVFLHHAIRAFTLNDVLVLLAICTKMLFGLAVAPATDDALPPPAQAMLGGVAPPTSLQLCLWICALVDGHFAPLVMAASADASVAAALTNLESLVQQQLVACENFETVQSVLSNFLSGVKLPKAHGIPDYSIEELLL